MPVVRYLKWAKIVLSLLSILGSGFLFGLGWPVLPATAAPTELFFSEYVEGSGNNKALEIFNGTAAAIDLAVDNYEVQIFFNGSITPTTIALTGTIVVGDVYVLADDGADLAILAETDQIYSGAFFNGNDALALSKNGVIVDVIGRIGEDPPGSQWGSGLTSTVDRTLRRKFSIEAGDNNGNDPFDPAAEWVGFPQDTFDGLGWHTTTPSPLTVVINEVAWGGTAASSADEWLELSNTTDQTISLDGWVITSTNGLHIPLDGTTIAPNGYYLIERTDDNAISDIAADLVASFGSGLVNSGDTLFLSTGGVVIDTANEDGGPWSGGTGTPDYTSMERLDSLLPDTDTNWDSNDTIIRNGQNANGGPINGTPKQANSTTFPPPPPPPPPALILISEFLYDGLTPSTEGDEFVELCNPNAEPVDLTGYKVGDEESFGKGESMYQLPISTTLAADACLVVAKNAAQFQARFGYRPDFEVVTGSSSYGNDPTVPNLTKYTTWASGKWALANTGDELLVLGPGDEILDSVAYRQGDYASLALEPDASAPEPHSLQRVWAIDTDSMPDDFVRTEPNPGLPTVPPPPPADPPPPAVLPGGMNAYWGHLHAHTTYSDGAGPPHYALAMARAAGLHYYTITDHGWQLTEKRWTKTLTQTTRATVPGQFVALRGLEWGLDTAGHVNIFHSDTLLSHTDPMLDDLSDFYAWLAAHPEAIAQFNHPDPGYGGTFYDFAFHPAAAQTVFMQEIGNSGRGYTTYEPAFVQSNAVGWRTGPTNNGDTHEAKWGTDTTARTGLVAPALTKTELLAAMRARRVFATEDSNLALVLRGKGVWMGSVIAPDQALGLVVDFVDPEPEPLTLFLYDSNLPLATVSWPTSSGQWTTTVKARPGHYFWAKVVQADGDTAYSAPIWIEGQASPAPLSINEVLPAPKDWDWDGDGTATYGDESIPSPFKRY